MSDLEQDFCDWCNKETNLTGLVKEGYCCCVYCVDCWMTMANKVVSYCPFCGDNLSEILEYIAESNQL